MKLHRAWQLFCRTPCKVSKWSGAWKGFYSPTVRNFPIHAWMLGAPWVAGGRSNVPPVWKLVMRLTTSLIPVTATRLDPQWHVDALIHTLATELSNIKANRWLQWYEKSLGSQQFGFDILFRVVTKRLPKLCISYPKCEANSQVTSEMTCNAEYIHVVTSSIVGEVMVSYYQTMYL